MADILRMDCGNKRAKVERLGGYCKHLRRDGSGDRKGSEIWLDCGYLLTVEPRGFPNDVQEQQEIKRRVKDDSNILGLNNWVRGKMPEVR